MSLKLLRKDLASTRKKAGCSGPPKVKQATKAELTNMILKLGGVPALKAPRKARAPRKKKVGETGGAKPGRGPKKPTLKAVIQAEVKKEVKKRVSRKGETEAERKSRLAAAARARRAAKKKA